MTKRIFGSVFAVELATYLKNKTDSGFKEESYIYILKKFDRFCQELGLTEPVFTEEHADKWLKKRDNEVSKTHYARINVIKNFLAFLSEKGGQIFVTRDTVLKPTNFQPYIYSQEEITRYFLAVDAFTSRNNKKDAVQYPVLFRLLYCCGTRINETLAIRKKDVNLKEGLIRLVETKNNRERYVVLGDDLANLVREFGYKSFYLLNDDDHIFTSTNGCRLSRDVVYERHRDFLKKAGIPYLGDGHGPRIQDWRHTFAVHAFKQLADAGLDLYVALPILSTYLGHKDIYSTEHYLRLTTTIYPDIERKFRVKMDLFNGGRHYENH